MIGGMEEQLRQAWTESRRFSAQQLEGIDVVLGRVTFTP